MRRTLLKTADIEQHNDSNSEASQADPTPAKFLNLEKFPSARLSVRLHSDLNLECEAVGSPAPKIHWLKNGIPLGNQQPLNHQVTTSFTMSKVKSMLRFQCILPDDEAEYTCVAHNGHQKVIATTNIVIEGTFF